MISEVGRFFLSGLGKGGVDSDAEFMFSVGQVWIRDGAVRVAKGVTISGQAFEALVARRGLSGLPDMGAGHCGKWQPAKVDAGGPYLRCRVTIGGRQDEREQ